MTAFNLEDTLPEDEPSPWMTIAEAARFLRVTEHTVHAYARAGKLKKHRVSDFKTVRVLREDVEKMVAPAEG